MPMPKPRKNEKKQDFVSRCMGDEIMKKDYTDNKQRVAVCLGQLSNRDKTKGSLLEDVCDIIELTTEGFVQELNSDNVIIPDDNDYVDFGEDTIEYDLANLDTYVYLDTVTNQLHYFNRMGNYKKDGRNLMFLSKSAEYQGRKVTLNKPFRTPDGPKKFAVYTTNDKGKVVIVRFGDPNMEIKKDIPSRRKSFRARMRCDSPGPKWKARYWACKSW